MTGALKSAGIGLAATALVAGLGLALWPARESAALLRWDDAEAVARGHEIYDRNCAVCHGPLSLSGQILVVDRASYPAPPHDASGHSWQHPDYALFKLTKTGEVEGLCRVSDGAGMPKFGQILSDRQIVDVLSYIKATWPTEIRAQQDATNTLYAAQNAAVRALIDTSGG